VKVDRYTKVVLTVIAVALAALAINYFIAPLTVGAWLLALVITASLVRRGYRR
jgi:ABC-type thiamin/hydroxymethylpyrimidine transport system permease subunit